MVSPWRSYNRARGILVWSAILGVSQVKATPLDFNSYGICGVPTKKHGHHGHPVLNELVNFALEDSDGQLITAWSPGEAYTLTTASASAKRVHTFVQASTGHFDVIQDVAEAEAGFIARACNNAWGSHTAQHQHSVTWIAPEAATEASQCVVFSAVQSGAEHEAYQTNTVEICSHEATATKPQSTAANASVSQVTTKINMVSALKQNAAASSTLSNSTVISLRTHAFGSFSKGDTELWTQEYETQRRHSWWQHVFVVIGGAAVLAAAAALIVNALRGRQSHDAWARAGLKAHRSSASLRAPLLVYGAVVPPRARSLERTRSHPFAP